MHVYYLTPERWNLLNRRIAVLLFWNIIIFEFWSSYSWKSMNFNFGNEFCNVGIARDWKNSRKQVPDDSKNKLFPSHPMSRILPIILDYLYFSILALPFSSASAVYTQRNIFSFSKNPRAATRNWRKFISAQRSKIFNEPPLARCSIKNCSCFYVLPFFDRFSLCSVTFVH